METVEQNVLVEALLTPNGPHRARQSWWSGLTCDP